MNKPSELSGETKSESCVTFP